MIAALVPSIASSMKDELAAISDEIRAKPDLRQQQVTTWVHEDAFKFYSCSVFSRMWL